MIEQILRENALPAPSRGYARDTITLGWEDRLHVRGWRRSDGGVAFGLSLPRGTIGYSDGLEAATAAGLVQTPADLRAWLDVCLDEVVGPTTDWVYRSEYPALK